MSIDEKAFEAAYKSFDYVVDGRFHRDPRADSQVIRKAIEAYEAAKAPVSLNVGALAMAAVTIKTQKGPAKWFLDKCRKEAKTCAEAWGLPYVD